MKKISFPVRKKIIDLSGACFWYWGSFHCFLEGCGVSQSLIDRYPQGAFSKYDVMKNILSDLESQQDNNTIENIVSGFFQLQGVADDDVLDVEKASRLLAEFRALVGDDPIEKAG